MWKCQSTKAGKNACESQREAGMAEPKSKGWEVLGLVGLILLEVIRFLLNRIKEKSTDNHSPMGG